MVWPNTADFCCETLREITVDVPNPLIVKHDDGVAMLAIGFTETENGVGWFDHALLYCPFCGTQLQTESEIASKAVN